MPVKRTHQQASTLLRKLGATPLEQYPGNITLWLVRCDGCNSDVRIQLKGALKFGRPHGNCPGRTRRTRKLPEDVACAVMLAAQLLPLEPYTDSKMPWRCRCYLPRLFMLGWMCRSRWRSVSGMGWKFQ